MDELTKALTDYYDPRTDLVRKQQLHDQLNRFLTDRNSWQIAVMTLQEQNGHLVTSPVVIYFLLQILEHSIRHRYGDQQQIRQILIYLFVHLFDSIPVYVRTKFSFLLVQLARCDNQWSIDEYFQTCFHLIENQSMPALLWLTTTIEELGQCNEDCTIKRCQLLKSMLNQHVPHIVQIIQIFLKKEQNEMKDPKQQTLKCFDRLINRLSILPLSSDLIDDLFHYASSSMSIDAWNCIHELILKQHIPKQYESILYASLRHVIQLINISNQHLSSDIRQKKIEILRSIFTLHLKRYESMEHQPILELLTSLYKFTFEQTTQDGFYACLDIWSIFVEYLKSKDEDRLIRKDDLAEKYAQILQSLSQELLQRIHHAQSTAKNLEETTDLNDNETAIDRFRRECVDLLSKLADMPNLASNILHLLITLLQPEMEKYKTIQKLLQTSPNDPSRQQLLLNNESIPGCSQVLNSLSNVLYAFARIANTCLLDDNNHQQAFFQTRLTLVHQLVQLVLYIIHLRYDLIECSSKEIHQELMQIQTRAFECVTNLTPWLGQMLVAYQSQAETRRMIEDLIVHIIDNCAPLIDVNNSDKPIAISAASLLASLVPQTRAHLSIDQMNSIKHLSHRILTWNVLIHSPTNFQLYKLSIKLLLSFILLEQHSSEHFFQTIFQPLNAILNEPTNFFNQPHLRPTFLHYTQFLTELIESIRPENKKSRQNLFSAIQYLIINLNRFLPFIVNRDAECETMLISFLLNLFDVRLQIGTDLINSILQTTFSAFHIENVRNVLREAKPHEHTSVSRFVELLSLLVNEPGNSKLTQQYLPTIIELCTTALYPAIRENFSLDIRENYYKLVHNLLINNWRYFSKGNVLTTMNGEVETTAHEQSFLQLMESIAWSFSQTDIEQFRTNLSFCNDLQSKCGLYSRTIFRQQMSQALLSLLLSVLLARSHELCRDEIISTIFAILTNDPTKNFMEFIRQYIEQSNIQLILNEKHRRILLENYGRNETDLPTFSQNLNDFIHDYRHYTQINSN